MAYDSRRKWVTLRSMLKQLQSTQLRRLRPLFLLGIAGLIIMQIVALSPKNLEQNDDRKSEAITESELLPNQDSESILATGIPKNKVPDYTVEGFDYVSTQSGHKQWKLIAKKAFLYQKERMVHARDVTAYLYDADDKITVVRGKEAKYFMNQKDLEVFGDVKTKFPDGFMTESEYLKYRPQTKKIDIPVAYHVKGFGDESDSENSSEQKMEFESNGLSFAMGDSQIVLPQAVVVTMYKGSPSSSSKGQATAGVAEKTTIKSDHCIIYRNDQLAHFTMYEKRPLKDRFVEITQPGMFAKSRRTDLRYGDLAQVLQYLTAYEDVYIREVPKSKDEASRYGTGGRADFDTRRNVIILKEFPQVYQDNDTVTGDIIVVHRDTDIVEVEHSNAYSEGEKQEP